MRIRYREGRLVVQRTIDPLGLVLKGGVWYLIARRAVGMRVYRVSRVAARADARARTSSGPPGFELADFWEEWSRAFEQGRPRVDVTVRVSEEVAPPAAGRAAARAGRPRRAPFDDLGLAYRELLRFGADVEVLEPVELRERIAGTAREVAALYGR